MTAATRAPLDGRVPPEIVSSVFHSATVSDDLAILVAETSGRSTRVTSLMKDPQSARCVLHQLRALGVQPAIDDFGTLDLCTVAEGVETEEQVQALSALGATYLQGFTLARPMDGRSAATFFATRQGVLIR